jgi:hypothetical protein
VYNTFSRVCSLCTLFLAKCLYNFRLSTCAFETISKELIRKKQKKKNFYKLQEKKTFEGWCRHCWCCVQCAMCSVGFGLLRNIYL